jgi:hypothetical protein
MVSLPQSCFRYHQNSTLLSNTFRSHFHPPHSAALHQNQNQTHTHLLYHTSSTILDSQLNQLSKLSTKKRFFSNLQISLIQFLPFLKIMNFQTPTYAQSLENNHGYFQQNPIKGYCQSFNFFYPMVFLLQILFHC